MKITTIFFLFPVSLLAQTIQIIPIGGNSSTLSDGQSNQVITLINNVAPTNGGITAAQAATQINSTNTSVTIPEINTASNNIVTGLPRKTNYIAFDWANSGTTTNVGNALVLNGFDTFGSPLAKGTNWPSGGGSQTPWISDINAATFNLYDLGVTYWTNNILGNAFVAASANYTISDDGVTLALFAESNGVTATSSILVDRLIAQNQIRVQGGSISVIPTNAAPVNLTLSASGLSLPVGITNVFAGRAEPIVQYYLIDAVGGVPILTFSNEQTGVKLRIAPGALASFVETNFCTLPVTTTNSVWRLRDESGGTGASVGIITNWLIGL